MRKTRYSLPNPILVAFLVLLCAFGNLVVPVHAEYNLEKTSDWKYHAYMCKNIIANLKIISEIREERGEQELEEHEETFKNIIIKSVLTNEKQYEFDEQDASIIATLVFEIKDGLTRKDDSLTIGKIITQGFDICIEVLDATDKQLLKAK